MSIILPPTDSWPLETLHLQPAGKSPKAYGPGVWRFAPPLTLSVVLPKRGWQLLKKSKHYVYLRPPQDMSQPPFDISIAIPTKEQFIVIAREQRMRGESWMGQLGEWPAWYIHKQVTTITESLVIDRGGPKKPNRTTSLAPVSWFSVGESGVWSATMHWDEMGERYSDSREAIVFGPAAGSTSGGTQTSAAPGLFEGRVVSVELTSYERNPDARRLCLMHHGFACQVCSFDFERTYGTAGRGYIHVHHRVPLSEIAAEYVVDPVRDLVPVCPNCHGMIHTRQPPYGIDELRAILRKQQAGSSNKTLPLPGRA